MTTQAMVSEGIVVARSNADSPETFTNIGEVQTVDGPGGQAAVITVSHFQSTAVEKLMGLPDEGQVTLGGNFLGTTNGTIQTGLRTDRTNRTLRNFKITLTDSPATVLTFQAYVLGFSLAMAVEAAVTYSVTLEVSGPVTYA